MTHLTILARNEAGAREIVARLLPGRPVLDVVASDAPLDRGVAAEFWRAALSFSKQHNRARRRRGWGAPA